MILPEGRKTSFFVSYSLQAAQLAAELELAREGLDKPGERRQEHK